MEDRTLAEQQAIPGVGQTVARNSLFGIAGQLALKLLSFCFTIVVVRQLGEQRFGVYATVVAFVGIFAVFADLGMAGYGVRAIAQDRRRASELFGNMVLLRLALSTVVLLSNVGLAWLLGYPASTIGLIALGSLGLLLYAVQGPIEVVLQGFERLDLTTSYNVLSQILFIGAGGLLLWLGWGIAGVIVASFVGIIVSAGNAWRVARRLTALPLRVAPQTWRGLLAAGLPFGVITFATMLSFKADTVLLSLWRSPAEVGWYNVAYNLIFTLLMLSTSFNNALVPSLSRHARVDPDSVTRFYLRALRLLWTCGLPIAVGGTLLGDRLIVLLYGAAYAPAGLALRILIWVLPVLMLTSLCGAITTILHLEHAAARVNLINAGFNITLNLWAIPRYGLLGAALMTLATELLGLLQYTLLLRNRFPLRMIMRSLRAPLLAAALLALTLLTLESLALPLLIAVGGLVYGGGLLLSGGITIGEVQELSGLVLAQLKRRPRGQAGQKIA